MPAANAAQAVELVKAAIARIRRAKEEWQDSESDPKSTTIERMERRRVAALIEGDFSFQWQNVEMILKEHGL